MVFYNFHTPVNLWCSKHVTNSYYIILTTTTQGIYFFSLHLPVTCSSSADGLYKQFGHAGHSYFLEPPKHEIQPSYIHFIINVKSLFNIYIP